jgi:hypothetical protein
MSANISAFGEEGHEVLFPAPRAVPGAVDEEDRKWE